MTRAQVQYQDWKLIDYKDAWDRQSEVHKLLVSAKRADQSLDVQGHLILCEHPIVFTLGKSGSEDHLLVDEKAREERGFQFYKINRGGDITHHGPGQLVGYPILDLEYWYRDVHLYVRNVEEVIIQTLATYGLVGIRIEGYTGVWIRNSNGQHEKICAIGVHLSRWVSMHGFALNVNNDLNLFQHIVPCGIHDENKSITSISRLLGKEVGMEELKQKISATFARVFTCTIKED